MDPKDERGESGADVQPQTCNHNLAAHCTESMTGKLQAEMENKMREMKKRIYELNKSVKRLVEREEM